MPELPEAETIARELHRRVSGRCIVNAVVERADIIRTGRDSVGILLGRSITSVGRQAKRVVIQLEPNAELVFQLGMTGRLTVEPSEQEIEKHTHFRLRFQDRSDELRFRDPRRFGGVWIFDRNVVNSECGRRDKAHATGRASTRTLGPIGLEPLDMTRRQFHQALARNRQIKALLMDQTAIAGLGNIYCDESLHAAGIHPLTPSNALDALAQTRLYKAIRSTLRRAIRHNGSTLMDYRTPGGEHGAFQRLHRVYQRDGRPCRTCRTLILRLKIAGRSTFVCPQCQPESLATPTARADRNRAQPRVRKRR